MSVEGGITQIGLSTCAYIVSLSSLVPCSPFPLVLVNWLIGVTLIIRLLMIHEIILFK
jgi:hypothetical protein